MYVYIETSKNNNKLSECISDLLERILFQRNRVLELLHQIRVIDTK